MMVFLLALPAWGQNLSQDSLSTGYRRGLNNDEWVGQFNYHKTFSNNIIEITDTFTSSRLKVGLKENKWKDEHKFTLNYTYLLLHNLNLDFRGDHLQFSDKQSGFTNDIKTHVSSLHKSTVSGVMGGVHFVSSMDEGNKKTLCLYSPHSIKWERGGSV